MYMHSSMRDRMVHDNLLSKQPMLPEEKEFFTKNMPFPLDGGPKNGFLGPKNGFFDPD